jgi:hypothetical protein
MNIVQFVLSREYFPNQYDRVINDLINTHDEFYDHPYEMVEEGLEYFQLPMLRPTLTEKLDAIYEDNEQMMNEIYSSHITFREVIENLDKLCEHWADLARHDDIPINYLMDLLCIHWEGLHNDTEYILKWNMTITREQIQWLIQARQHLYDIDHDFDTLIRQYLRRVSHDDFFNDLKSGVVRKYLHRFQEYLITYDNIISHNQNIDFERFEHEIAEYNKTCQPQDRLWFNLDYDIISSNPHLTHQYVMKNLHEKWDYNKVLETIGTLSVVDSSKYFMKLLQIHPDYHTIEWDGSMDNEQIYILGLSHPLLHPEFVANHLHKVYDYHKFIEKYHNVVHLNKMVDKYHSIISKCPFGLDMISQYGKYETIILYDVVIDKLILNVNMNWQMIQRYKLYERPELSKWISIYTDVECIMEHIDKKWDWTVLTHRMPLHYIMEHMDYSWNQLVLLERLPVHLLEKGLERQHMVIISTNPYITIEFIRKYKHWIHFKMLSSNEGLTFEMIDEFHDKLYMDIVAENRLENEKKSQIARFIASTI